MDRRRVALYALGIVTVVATTLVPEAGGAGPRNPPPAERPPSADRGKGGNEKPKPCKSAKPKHCSSM